jgi:hypothetical protein
MEKEVIPSRDQDPSTAEAVRSEALGKSWRTVPHQVSAPNIFSKVGCTA